MSSIKQYWILGKEALTYFAGLERNRRRTLVLIERAHLMAG